MPHIRLDFATTPAIPFLLALAAAAAAFLFYRYTVPPVPRPTRLVLAAMRGVALALLVILPFQPALHAVFTSWREPAVAVLADDTRSMRIVDRSGDRADMLRSILTGNALSSLGSHAKLAYFTFGTGLKKLPAAPGDTLPLDQNGTDIAGALRALAKEKEHSTVDALLLLSDGGYNLGENPVYAAGELAIPVYAVGIGDSSEQKDVLISRIAANDLVYSGVRAPVDVVVKSSGFDGERVEIILAEGTRELDRTTVTLRSGTREYPLQLAYTPEGEGRKQFSVRVSSLPGELTPANNLRRFSARVLRSKLRITILAGSMGPDLTVVKQTLQEEKNFSVRSFAQRTPTGFYEGQPDRTIIDSTDCFVLIGLPTASTPPALLDMLKAALTEQDRPVLFIIGPALDYSKLNAIAPVLPFTVGATSPAERYVSIHPTAGQIRNPLLAVGPSQSADVWDRLPPIFSTRTSFRAKPEATVIGISSAEGAFPAQPLMLSRSVSRQKSIAILGYGIWRWRLMAQGDAATEQVLFSFLSNAVRWLTTREENRPVRVTPAKESYSENERVDFIGQVYNSAAQPVDNAQIRVTVEREGTVTETDLMPIGEGRYEGSIGGLSEGEYTYHASARLDSAKLGDDAGRLSVGGVNLEYLDTRMNVDVLRQICRGTGGRFLSQSQAGGLDSLLSRESWFRPREVDRTSDIEAWDWHYVLAAIVLLFAAEWFVRKRNGML